jgi:hypothetical protein
MTAVYRKRENLFENDEWRIEDDAHLHYARGGAQTRLNWADVRSVRLRFSPSTAKPRLHRDRARECDDRQSPLRRRRANRRLSALHVRGTRAHRASAAREFPV